MLSQKYKEIKAHKKILKQEVVRLMDEIKELEAKLANSQSAIQSIASFFQNNLQSKLNEIKDRKDDKRPDLTKVAD